MSKIIKKIYIISVYSKSMVVVKKEGVLLTARDFKPSTRGFEVIGAFNPGVLKLKNGDILLYVRITERPLNWKNGDFIHSPRFVSNTKFKLRLDRFHLSEVRGINAPFGFHFKNGTIRLAYISHLRRVLLDSSGFRVKKIEQKPCFYGTMDDGELGIEDPRITKLDGTYVMTYVSLSRYNSISTSCAFSHDGYHWHKRGIIFRHQNKDVTIFPKKIRNSYVAFNRPEGNFEFSLPHMWVSFSQDLTHWGGDKTILLSKEGWDAARIGSGAPPVKTDRGWLEIYHGVKVKHYGERAKRVYCAGIALFDTKDPTKLLAKSFNPFIEPTHNEEREGWINIIQFF